MVQSNIVGASVIPPYETLAKNSEPSGFADAQTRATLKADDGAVHQILIDQAVA
jgi:hypothetical protein